MAPWNIHSNFQSATAVLVCCGSVLWIYGGNLSRIEVARMFLWRLEGRFGGWVSGRRGGVSGRFLGRSLKITHWILNKTILELCRTDEDDPTIKSRDARDFTLRPTLSNWNLTELLGDSSQAWDWTRGFQNEQSIIYRSQTEVEAIKESKITFCEISKKCLCQRKRGQGEGF